MQIFYHCFFTLLIRSFLVSSYQAKIKSSTKQWYLFLRAATIFSASSRHSKAVGIQAVVVVVEVVAWSGCGVSLSALSCFSLMVLVVKVLLRSNIRIIRLMALIRKSFEIV